MASFWKNLFDGILSPSQKSEDNSERNTRPNPYISDYPNTYQRAASEASVETLQIFEPALKHYSRAFRNGDPEFENAVNREKWDEVRRQVIDHLLEIIKNSKWKDHLVLRGSLLLKAWLGDAAREPGDIDWVFRPENVGSNDSLSNELFADLIRIASENPAVGEAVIKIDKIAVDDIWTYERAAGKRIIFPWKIENLPPGYVQMDVVFNEPLWSEPVQTFIPNYRNSSKWIWSVNKEVSLAWKLLWLETDMYPQGKDLYDAALLAEQTHLSHDLLKRILQSSDWRPRGEELNIEFPLRWEIDWGNFKLEYPWVEGEAKEWQARLSRALTPTFESAEL